MKRLLAAVLVVLMMTGCAKAVDDTNAVVSLRRKLEAADGCIFDATITADYDDKIYTFGMKCSMDQNGTLSFTVVTPETISQITGSVSETGGKLTFDDRVLAFEMLADDMISPIIGPWLMIRCLRGGYIHSAARMDGGISARIDDTFRGENLQVQVGVLNSGEVASAEFLYKGKRFLTIAVNNFVIV